MSGLSPLRYVRELLDEVQKEAGVKPQAPEAPQAKQPQALKVADFLDKVARELREENPEVFDKKLQDLFVGEGTDENTLKLREGVKQRILQLQQGIAPPG